MEIWLSIAIGYCVLCWFLGFLITRTRCYESACEVEDGSQGSNRLVESSIILFAPVYFPLVAIYIGWCVIGALLQLRVLDKSIRTFRAYEYIKVNFLELDESIREVFEKFTPPLLKLNFDLIGDYRLKPEPVEVHDRFLLSEDGETLAAICALLDAGDICFMSVLEDGTSVDTTGSENPHPERTYGAEDQIWVSYLPDTPVKDMYEYHVQKLKDLCARNGTRVLRFQRDQFSAIVTYDQRVHCRWRYRHGGMDKAPPAPDFATLLATPVEKHDAAKQVAAS